ncbi:MAG: ribonuclease M5 [Anaerovoracaceae bacterium]|nr:ribonuclease M5 [Anaerovoracaceae bacterium]
MKIKEIIIVEGKDDRSAVRAALDAETIETHGYGISQATWERIRKAAEGPGIIIFTDPDYAGEQIRQRVGARFPDAKHAFLPRGEAEKNGDIGIENASPESILEALKKVHSCRGQDDAEPVFTKEDLLRYGLSGEPDASLRRDRMGKALGIGYGNAAAFLKRLNRYGITREEFEYYGETLFPRDYTEA